MPRSGGPSIELHRSPHDILSAGFASVAPLTPGERARLQDLHLHVRDIAAQEIVVHEGDNPQQCSVLLSGFFCRHIMVDAGQRQVLSFHLPGEIPDLQTLLFARMNHSIAALTSGRVACVSHAALREAALREPGLSRIFWGLSLRDGAIAHEWLASTGRRTAYQKVAHLFCELFVRMSALGVAEPGGFKLPVTQIELADALGLSPVHVNRTLQQLRRDGIIVSHGKHLGFGDWERLRAAGDFDPSYLHLRETVA